MRDYICFTKQGKWNFQADNDFDAMRLALFYCWRDGEDFIKVESKSCCQQYTLRICVIDKTNSIQTL